MSHLSPPMPVLHTERLLLRPPTQEDFEAWAAFQADPLVAQFIGGVQPRAIAWRSMATVVGSWTLRGYGMFSVIEKASNRWVGRLGPWYPEGWPAPEVGWSLAREFWGRGYATEGAAAAMDYVFEVLGWEQVIHAIAPENHASIALARRLGSTRLWSAQLPPPVEHVCADIYGQTREAWRARRFQRSIE